MPYAMAPVPAPQHQRVSIRLGSKFEKALEKCNQCKVYAPLDWKLKEDTVVQPDLLIVCDKIEKKYLDFPPALVIKILWPATASKDRGEKMELYQQQQVKYYLIVDPQFKKVEIYQFIQAKYKLIADSWKIFSFELDDNCVAKVNLWNIWE